MIREIIICIGIIVIILTGNIITQNYTDEFVNEISQELNRLSEIIILEKKEIINEKVEKIQSLWKENNTKLAYFIEHDELEKVETSLESMKSYLEVRDYDQAKNEIDKNIFILKHIEKKYDLNLENIF